MPRSATWNDARGEPAVHAVRREPCDQRHPGRLGRAGRLMFGFWTDLSSPPTLVTPMRLSDADLSFCWQKLGFGMQPAGVSGLCTSADVRGGKKRAGVNRSRVHGSGVQGSGFRGSGGSTFADVLDTTPGSES